MKILDIINDTIIPYFPDEDADLIRFFPERKFNIKKRRWEIPVSFFDKALKIFKGYELSEDLQQWLKVKAIVPTVAALLSAVDTNQPLPCGLFLHRHQKEGIAWLLRRKAAILSDDMGLGKTITALMAAKAYQTLIPDIKIIVVCPVSLKKNWLVESEKVGVTIETHSWAKIPKSVKNKNGDRLNYLLIADESHYAQSRKSQRTKQITELAHNVNCIACYLLTGTPMKNGRPSNLLPLLSIIRHPIASNETQFLKRYCDAKWKALGKKKIWDESGADNLKELADLISDRLLRRMKAEVLDLPPKVRILQEIQLDPIIEKACLTEINEVMSDFWERVKTNQVSEDAAAMVQLGVIRRISSKYKSEHIFKMIEELTEQGQQVVIFTEFVETVNMISDFLTISFTPHVTLTGATKDRQAVVDDFQSGKAKVFVGTSKAGGVGITLTKSSNVILIDRPWTPGDTEQAEDRCYRIGQKESVFCYWIQWGEIDKGIDDLLQNKQANISIVLKGKTASIKASNLNDFAKQVVQAYRF